MISELRPIRPEQEVFEELESLVTEPGYIHAVANLVLQNNLAIHSGTLKAKDLYGAYSQERLIRTEISTLIGLMCRSNINFTPPGRKVLEGYIERTHSLLKELHRAIADASFSWEKIIDQGKESANPFANGNAMREPIFYAGESAYTFQYLDLAVKKYVKDKEWLLLHKGFTIEEAGEVVKAIVDFQPEKIQRVFLKGIGDEDFPSLDCLTFSIPELSQFCGLSIQKIQAVINAFLFDSNSRNGTFTNLHEFNEINAAPILQRSEGDYVLLQTYSLLEAMYESPFYWFLRDQSYKDQANANRGSFLEEQTALFLNRIFPSENVYKNILLRSSKGKSVGEIDVLVIYGDRALVFQNKSKKLTLEARKGNDLVLRKDFQSSVQEAYDQAILCSGRLIQNQDEISDLKGNLVKLTMPIKEAYIFCILSDHYPALTFQARNFLKIKEQGPQGFPYVADIFTLDVLTELINSPLQFISFIKKRAEFQEVIFSQSELSILGYHLKKNLYAEDELLYLMDDLSADVDVAMTVRRTGVPGLSIPEGILTRYKGTPLEKVLLSIDNDPSPEKIEVGLLILSLSEQAWFDISKTISHISSMTMSDGRNHDCSFPFRADKTGLTIHVNNDPLTDSRSSLLKHCEHRKYIERAEAWLGVLLDPGTFKVKAAVSIEYGWQVDRVLNQEVSTMNKPPLSIGAILKNIEPHSGLKVGRNDPCKCGSGRKYKKCCMP